MKIDMNLLKQLRDATLASFSDCKKALTESAGDMDKAKEWLRERGAAKAAKKADRETGEGAVKVRKDGERVLMVKLFCETDFVAKNETFAELLDVVLDVVAKESGDVESKDALSADAKAAIEAIMQDYVLKLGENIQVGDVFAVSGNAYAYNHAGAKLCSIVFFENSSDEVMKEVALQVAAMNPQYLSLTDIAQSDRDAMLAELKEKLIEEGKPENMVDQIAMGQMKKALRDEVLLEQVYIRDNTKKIQDLIGDAVITKFVRISIG